jgi:RNA polymerase sigma-70 factor (ECF subfamily)
MGEGQGATTQIPRAAQPHADFAELYATHFKSLTVQLYSYCGDLASAQDIAQEAFCRALDKWKRVASYDDPVAWVRRVAWNLATSGWRRRRTAQRYLEQQRLEHVEPPSPNRVALTRALAKLPEQQRRAVVLYYVADLSIDQIADQERVTAGTVKSRLHRGRTALAAALAEGGRSHG